jgi:PTH1 family peptidyl-tRNA hydrolase
MKLVVGLGNVGERYSQTRHNLGFLVVDRLAELLDGSVNFSKHPKAQAKVLDLKHSHNCLLVKPTTMMNLSGQAVGELARYYKVESTDIWVIYDDVDLSFGQLRIRLGGPTGGGHNGVKSVIEHVGEQFWRARMGVANEHRAGTATDRFVLDRFNSDELASLPQLTLAAAQLLQASLVTGQLDDHTRSLLEAEAGE